ncbi:MAG: glycosyltransferase, partial [Candidatus Rokuibacteriota bacterium]
MRVCLVSNLYPPDVLGGAEVVVGNLARGLQAAGHEVMVVATAPRARAGRETVDGLRVHHFGPANIYWAGEAAGRARILKPLWHLVD